MRISKSTATRILLPFILLTAVLVLGIYRIAVRVELDRTQQIFQDLTDDEARHVERRLAVALESLYALRAFFHGSEEVTDAEFDSFARDLCQRHMILQAMEWVPAVDRADRTRHESEAREAGLRDYSIREMDENGRLVVAGERDRYYPVRYLEPATDQEQALGFDLASETARRRTLLLAAREQRAVISDPVELVQGTRGETALLAALPVESFVSDQISEYAQGGFLLAVLSLGADMELLTPARRPSFFDIQLVDEDLEGNPPIMSWTSPHPGAELGAGIEAAQQIEIGGRHWRFEARPRREFVESTRTALPFLLAGSTSGLLVALTITVTAFFRLSRERSRRRHAQILDSVLETVDEGIIVADAHGHLLVVNDAARRYIGRVDDQLSVSQWPTRVGAYHSDEKTLFEATELPLVRAMRGETVSETEVFVRNTATPKGAWITVTGKPLVDPTGERKGGVIVIRDHTSEKMAQASLDRLGRAVEATADAVFITRRDGTIDYVNEAFVQVTGYSRREALGETPRILRSGRHDARFYRELWSTILIGDVHRCSIINRRKSGETFDAELTITPMRSASGDVRDFVAVMKDMTESVRRQAQEVELRLAAQVQQRLYPHEFPNVEGWEFAGRVLPAEATCGDYYDFVTMNNGHIGMAIGDVCGHGLGPALVMSEVRTLLRLGATTTSDPAQLVRMANETLTQDLEDHSFVTLLLATIETKTRRLQWVNAGHPSGFVLKRTGEVRVELGSQTLPLGIVSDFAVDQADEAELERGDLVLLVTDGVTEAGPDVNRQFGSEGAVQTLRALRDRPVEEIVDGMIAAVHEFHAQPQTDDVTLIVMRVG